MIFLKDYSAFRYTKIQVPITLKQCPSDLAGCEYHIDIALDSFSQEHVYIGHHFVERFQIHRLIRAKSPSETKFSAPRWLAEFILPEVYREDEAVHLLSEFCLLLSQNFFRQDYLFQYSGWAGFSFQPWEIQRRYSISLNHFGDADFNQRCGDISMYSLNTIRKNIFQLPSVPSQLSPTARELIDAFLIAMKSTDPVARYILLYYLFELMYKSESYRQTRPDIKHQRSRKRSIILCEFLKTQFQISSYCSFDSEKELTPDILETIILTRDRLAHAADTSAISNVMYHHMLPILQKVLQSLFS